MPSVFSHAVSAFGIAALSYRPGVPNRVWITGAVCAALPDIDVIGFSFGVRYGDVFGHRGFTHSFAFAAILAALMLMMFHATVPGMSRTVLWLYLFTVTASHGLLDAMTDGGLGVAFFSPFSNRRYFFAFTPIRVAPIGISRFFSSRGLEVLRSELVWVWVPTAVLIATAYGYWTVFRTRGTAG